jgi:diaminopimelate epimerase
VRISFVKMNGAGNDFIMIDNRERSLPKSAAWVRELCDRRRGIGADGVILIEPEPGADFRMAYFNSDGGEAEMCGNGARCASLFASRLGLGHRDGESVRLAFAARAGRMEAVVRGATAAISLTDAKGFERAVSLPIPGRTEIVHLIDTGVPHAVCVVEKNAKLTNREVAERGRAIRYHEKLAPAGANVDFVWVGDDGKAIIRTYERGVEAETLACGTGSVASAVVLSHLGLARSPVELLTLGGDVLTVSFAITPRGATNVVLEGPTAVNFEGNVDVRT